MSTRDRQLHLNVFLTGAGHHPAAWRHTSASPSRLFQLDYYSELARLAEAAKLDALYINDRLANRGHQPAAVLGHFESFTLLAALAVRTQNIGLIASASSVYNQPFHVARKLASLDYISGGRTGWSIRPSRGDDEAHNYGLDNAPSRAVRDERTREFVDVAKKLWDSWQDGAFTYTPENGLRTFPHKVHAINHHGGHFDVEGPLNVPRPLQGHPVLAQDYTGGDGENFGALENADLIFTSQTNLDQAIDFYAAVKRRVAELGRDPQQVKVLNSLEFVLGDTPEEARTNKANLDALLSPQQGLARLSQLLKLDLSSLPLDSTVPESLIEVPESAYEGRAREVSSWARQDGVTLRDLVSRLVETNRHYQFVGTPQQLADVIEDWFESGATDGFNLRPALLPLGLEQFATQVVPELQRRGLFRTEYEGTTLRSHYGLPHIANPAETEAVTV